jgi:hypothetical protein
MPPKIIEYKLCWDETNNKMAEQINRYITEGWQPYGFPYAVEGRSGTYQAMVKYAEENN